MPMTRVRVPGKVMLSGEYSVLYGATAVLIPVPRYLEIQETHSANIYSYSPVVREVLNMEIPEISEFESEHGKPAIEIDRSLFLARDESGNYAKLGLGSSAAEAVGVVKLRFLRASHISAENPKVLMEYAFKAHDLVQGGIGSGADIAACVLGSPIKYNSKYDQQLDSLVRYASGLQIEYHYPMYLVWSGVSADTRVIVKKFSDWYHHGTEIARELMAELIKLADELSDLWFMVPQKQLFDKLDEYRLVMMECAKESGILYRLPIHENIEAWAEEHGGRAKPTGAGGGDMILLIGDLPVSELKQLVIPLTY